MVSLLCVFNTLAEGSFLRLQIGNVNRLNFWWRGAGLIVLGFFFLLIAGIWGAQGKARLVNRAPEISVPDSQWVAEGDRLFFEVTATDPDVGDVLELSDSLEGASSLPAGSQFEQNRIERGTFVELKGPSGMSLLNYKLRGVDGETGEVYCTAIISSTDPEDTIPMPSDGYYVIAHDSSVDNCDLINTAIDFQNANGFGDNILLLSPSGDTLDALGYGPADTSGWSFCGEGSPATDVPRDYSLGRYPDGTDTDDNSVDFDSFSTPTPGVSNGSSKGSPGKSDLVINEVRYETSDYYQKGSFNWATNYDEAGVYRFIFIVQDNGSPQLADTDEVVVTVTESAPDTVIALENSATSSQQNVSLPIYLDNPYHFIGGVKINVECQAMKFDSVDFTSSCVADFPEAGYQFSNDSTTVSVGVYKTVDSSAVITPGAGRKLFFTMLGQVRDCAQSAPLQFTTFAGYVCQMTDTLGINTYYPVEINGDLEITDSHPDTISLSNVWVSPGDSTELPVYITNPDHTLDSLYVELHMTVPYGMELDFSRIDTTGTCVGGFNYFDYGVLNWPNLRIASFEAKVSGANPLGPSSEERLLFNIVITADTSVAEDTTLAVNLINSTTLGQGPCAYEPGLINGSVTVGSGPTFIRGDYDASGDIAMPDALGLLLYKFHQPGGVPPPCEDAADYDDSGDIAMPDALGLLLYKFHQPGGVPPPPPYPDCGIDPTEDALGCDSYPPCAKGAKRLVSSAPVSVEGAANVVKVGESYLAEDGLMVVPVELTNEVKLRGFEFAVNFDPALVTVVEVRGGDGYDFFAPWVDNETGKVTIGFVPDMSMQEPLAAGQRVVAELVIKAKADAGLELSDVALYGLEAQVVDACWVNGVVKAGAGLPKEFALQQNYPNPFNPTTLIKYDLPVDCQVRLDVYNVVGQKVATLVDGQQKAGYKVATWNAQDLASGVYFYKLTAGDYSSIRKMVLLK